MRSVIVVFMGVDTSEFSTLSTSLCDFQTLCGYEYTIFGFTIIIASSDRLPIRQVQCS